MEFTLREIAARVGGDISGNPDLVITGVSEIQNSAPGTITFMGNMQYKKYISDTTASAIFVSEPDHLSGKNGIIVENPQLAIAKTLRLFYPEPEVNKTVRKGANIHPDSKIGENVMIEPGAIIENDAIIGRESWIGSNVYIGPDVIIGEHCRLYPNVTVYREIEIGNRVIIHSGTVIGCDGFGFVPGENIHEKIPQTGNVVIGDDVEIGSNTAIDRATIGSTKIGDMTKIDNLVHIGHNVNIGKGCLITAQVGIAGSVTIGSYCTFGGQAGVVPHVTIGDKSTFAAKSGITKSMAGGKIYAGYPAREIRDHHKREALIAEISRMRQKLDQLLNARKED